MSRVVMPLAYIPMILSSSSLLLAWYFRRICGSYSPFRSRGTSTSTSPVDVRTVFLYLPLRLQSAHACLLVALHPLAHAAFPARHQVQNRLHGHACPIQTYSLQPLEFMDIARLLLCLSDDDTSNVLAAVALFADRIAAAKVPVIVDAINNLPTAFESLGARLDNPALLNKAGVKVVTTGAAEVYGAESGLGH